MALIAVSAYLVSIKIPDNDTSINHLLSKNTAAAEEDYGWGPKHCLDVGSCYADGYWTADWP